MKRLIPILALAALAACNGIQIPPDVIPTPPPDKPPVEDPCQALTCPNGCEVKDGKAQCKQKEEPPPKPQLPVCPDSAKKFLAKYMGQGIDSTPRCNDHAYCTAVLGFDADNCKARPEGNPIDYDTPWLGRKCPKYEYIVAATKQKGRCMQDAYNSGAPMSCDHWDHWQEWTDYQGTCEQVEEKLPDGTVKHVPLAGFFTIPHGPGCVRACDETSTHCTEWMLDPVWQAEGHTVAECK